MTEEEHARRYHGGADRLRSAKRLALLEVDRVVTLSLEGLVTPSVIDIGTGTGIFAEAFAARGLAVTGVDSNPALLEEARRIVPAAEFKQGTAEAIPCGDRMFDLAFLCHVLHETDEPVKALSEARRVAAARVVVVEWPYAQEGQGPPLKHRLKPEAVVKMARLAGFGEVEVLKLAHMVFYRMAKE